MSISNSKKRSNIFGQNKKQKKHSNWVMSGLFLRRNDGWCGYDQTPITSD
jgi:hypothetical protein